MLPIKHWIKDFFGFSRSQVNGFIILLPVIATFLFSEPVWRWWIRRQPIDFTDDHAKLDSIASLWSLETSESSTSETDGPDIINFFAFNPNLASNLDFIALGFSEKLATRIVNYRQKGGKFRIKSDLLKIYGVDSTFYHRLKPYIILPERVDVVARKKEITTFQKKFSNTKKELAKFNLNQADTGHLKKIYGIGEKLSLRIIKYRDALGGFTEMGQLKEVYGLDSTVVLRLAQASFLEKEFHPVGININTAMEKQLSSHPYFTKVAKAIVAYRFQHGEFKAIEDIGNIGTLDEKTLQKMIPYLKLKDE